MPFNGNNFFALVQQCQELTSPLKEKKPFFSAANWASSKCFPRFDKSPLCRCLWCRSRHGFGFREVEDHELRLMAPPSGFHRFTALIWEVLSVALHIHCGAHILPQIPSRETPLAYSGEADISQIKTPLNISLQNPNCDTTASLSLRP